MDTRDPDPATAAAAGPSAGPGAADPIAAPIPVVAVDRAGTPPPGGAPSPGGLAGAVRPPGPRKPPWSLIDVFVGLGVTLLLTLLVTAILRISSYEGGPAVLVLGGLPIWIALLGTAIWACRRHGVGSLVVDLGLRSAGRTWGRAGGRHRPAARDRGVGAGDSPGPPAEPWLQRARARRHRRRVRVLAGGQRVGHRAGRPGDRGDLLPRAGAAVRVGHPAAPVRPSAAGRPETGCGMPR